MAEKRPTSREHVRVIVEHNPFITAAEIATALGLSRQRVAQIIESEGLQLLRPSTEEVLAIGRRRPVTAKKMVSRVVTGGVPVKINSVTAGTIAELLVSADLMARGYLVFFPLTRTAPCDLVTLDKEANVERIEVRCGRRIGGRVSWQKPDLSHSDRRAIVITGEPVRFDPPFEGDAPE